MQTTFWILKKKGWIGLWTLFLLCCVFHLRAQAPSTPPSDMDFAVLNDSEPVSEFELQIGQYKGALGVSWHVITTNNYPTMKWTAVYSNDLFSISPSKFSKSGEYRSYLVSPAIQLADAGGKTLSMKLASVAGVGNLPFKVLLIKKDGSTIQTIHSEAPESTGGMDYKPLSITIPTGLNGVGFIAFVAEGNIPQTFRQFKLKDLKLSASSNEVSIISNPTSLSFDVIAAGEVGPTKELQIYINNFNGVPAASIVGPYSEDYRITNPNALSQTGGTIKVIFEPKSGGENKNASVRVQAGSKILEIPITGKATGAAPKIKVYSSPERLQFGATEKGKKSAEQFIALTIERAVENPTITLRGSNPGDFELRGTDKLNAKGGNFAVVFAPTQKGTRMAYIEVNAQGTTYSIPLQGEGTEGGVSPDPNPGEDNRPEPKEDKELLIDPYFYEFGQDETPGSWKFEGNVKKLEKGYNSSTGFAIKIDATQSEKGGAIYQDIKFKSFDIHLSEGDVLEGAIYYKVLEPFVKDGAVRLACEYLDDKGNRVESPEDNFFRNSRYIEYRKAWDRLEFRTKIPRGATQFRFRVETHAGSLVHLDDFSLLRLTKVRAQDEFISLYPHAFSLLGKVGEKIQETVWVQSMGLMGERAATWETPDGAGIMGITPYTMPKGNKVQEVSFSIDCKKKGAYEKGAVGSRPFVVKFQGEEARATFTVNTFIIDPQNPPMVKLSNETPIKPMECFVGETDTQEIKFDVSGVIKSVDLKMVQGQAGIFVINPAQFYYSKKQDNVLVNNVKITFRPLETIDYEGILTIETIGMEPQTFVIKGKGLTMNEGWVEAFSTDKEKDPRFTSDLWKEYHLFDRGYWYLEGLYKESGKVEIKAQGILESDEWFPNGIQEVTIAPASAATHCDLYYSVDGGGHWTRIEKAPSASGRYEVGTHRPTRFRLQNKGTQPIEIQKVSLKANEEKDRTAFKDIESAMLKKADSKALSLLSEDFNRTRHTRGLAVEGWQNLAIRADRPFYGWDQKNKATGKIEEHCAQISFLNSINKEDIRPQEAWLISPSISWVNAKSKYLTFRLRYELPTEDGEEKFGVYVLSEMKNGTVAVNYIDITKLLLVKDIDSETWYDYYVDLSTLNLKVDDVMHIAFNFFSPKGGKYTSLSFMVDDVTFGRTDLTTIKTDKEMLKFDFHPEIKTAKQNVKVTVNNPYYPLALTLVPKHLYEKFLLDDTTLPEDGGNIAVSFLSKDKKDYAAALLIQVRGGISGMVRLLAQFDNGVEMPEALTSSKVYPTCATDEIHIEGFYDRYYIFQSNGTLVLEGEPTHKVDISQLESGIYFVRLSTIDGGGVTHRFIKE